MTWLGKSGATGFIGALAGGWTKDLVGRWNGVGF